MKSKPVWQLALRNFLHFAIDVTIAIIGMIYGFGLTVQNWGAVLGLMFLTRWVTSTLHSAWLLDDAKKQAVQEVEVQLVPLTEKEIEELAVQEELLLVCDGLEALTDIVRAVEQAHRIKLTSCDGATP
jgi:hypothetical protein